MRRTLPDPHAISDPLLSETAWRDSCPWKEDDRLISAGKLRFAMRRMLGTYSLSAGGRPIMTRIDSYSGA
eukprot:5558258-Pleurochrysis_carterae.AAC.1